MIKAIRYIFILFLFFSAIPIFAEYAPEDMPNVNVANRYEFVSDPGNLLKPETKEQVNKILWNLRQQTSVEFVVALPPDIGDRTIEDWSEELFTSWGIGKKDKDNGVLLVIAPVQRMARIQTGYGTEGVLTDIASKKIITHNIAPHMREGDIDGAVIDAVTQMNAALTDPAVAEELKSEEADNYGGGIETLDKSILIQFIGMVFAICFFISLLYLLKCGLSMRGKDNYHKALGWRHSLHTLGWLSLLSGGIGLLIYLIAYLLYRRNRTKRRLCSTCGAKMNRLSEDKDNELLSSSQDFEEKLNTIDYDVWECPSCGTIERYPFKTKQLKYTECPNCHTVAMHLIGENTLRPASYTHGGYGEKIYECEYCHHQKRTPFTIPKKESAPVVILPPGGGGGGFGGGSFGGGFGGGSTGGGGASGGW